MLPYSKLQDFGDQHDLEELLDISIYQPSEISLSWLSLPIELKVSLHVIHVISTWGIVVRLHISKRLEIIPLIDVSLSHLLFRLAPDLFSFYWVFHGDNRALNSLFDYPILIELITELTIILFLLPKS